VTKVLDANGRRVGRRTFLRGAGLASCAAALGTRSFDVFGSETRPQVAITMDDFFFAETPLFSPAERSRKLLAAFAAHGIHASAYVMGQNAESEESRVLLAEWKKAGHAVGNHTYSHRSYEKTSFEDFSADIIRAEHVLEKIPGYEHRFRFPYFKEGDTAEKRDRMRAFLRQRGYSNDRATIDASDWYVDSRMADRLKAKPDADLTPYRDFYLGHIWDRAQYYDGLAREAIGHTVPHTLLVHFSLLNALFMNDLLSMFSAKGWQVIDAKKAYEDPIYATDPKILPAGESLIWAIAKENGKHSRPLRYPGEDGDYEKPAMDALGL
jgi:peptidoglycan/xylan/chitin deacetylase (PgdA/CDA1 family)